MLRTTDHDHTVAFVCDVTGNPEDLLCDIKGFFAPNQPLPQAEAFLAPSSLPRYQRFIRETIADGHSLNQDMTFRHGDGELSFALFGLCKHSQVFVIAVQSAAHLFKVHEEFMKMINEQARQLRSAQQDSMRSKDTTDAGTALLEDYMLLNNELANKQRELAVANKLLQTQEKRIRDLINSNPDAQLVLGSENRVLFLNPAANAIFGLSNELAEGQIFPLDLHQEGELCLNAPSGKICVEVLTTPVNWSGTEAKLFSLRDITQRKETEQIREDVERILRHDLISPLNPIVALPEVLLLDDNLTREQKEMIGMIRSAGKRMLGMIRLSLNLYKMEQGVYDFAPQGVNLVVTFHDILSDLSERIRSKGVRVTVSKNATPISPGDSHEVLAESVLCYSLFSNIVLNSIEASPRGGLVTIELGQDGPGSVAVHNAGAVPVEIRSRFFEKYATSGKTHGTGLGTYSARLMVLTMGGSISMETSDDAGTTVFVTLPVPPAATRSSKVPS